MCAENCSIVDKLCQRHMFLGQEASFGNSNFFMLKNDNFQNFSMKKNLFFLLGSAQV